jgi:hypothetical protein
MTSVQMLEVVLRTFGLEGGKKLPEDLSELEEALGTRKETQKKKEAQDADQDRKAAEMLVVLRKVETDVRQLYFVLPQVMLMRRFDVYLTNKEFVDLYVKRARKAATYQGLIKKRALP